MVSLSRKLALSAAASAMALSAAPAMAGGHVSAGYYYGGGYYHHAGYRHHGHYYSHHHGGRGAAIALGVIGGAIILNELAEERARDRYYEDRYYEERARDRAYDQGYYDGRADARRYEDRYEDRNGDDAYYDDGVYEDDGDLAGGQSEAPAPVVSSAIAYQTCLTHARRALGERGYVVSAPYRPETVEDRGGALLMTATVLTQRGSESWSRAMSCEASETRVYRMELI